MEVKPLPGYLVLEPVVEEEKSGIILVDNADLPPTKRGRVIDAGTTDFSKGQQVYYKAHKFEEIAVDKKTYNVGLATDVFAIYA